MTRVLALQVDRDMREVLDAHAQASGETVEHATATRALRRLEQDPTPATAVVIGSVPDPIRTAQRTNMAAPGVPIVVLCSPQDCETLARALEFAPFVNSDIRCLPHDPIDVAMTAIRGALERAEKRHRHARTLEALNRRLAAADDGPRPDRTASVLGRLLDVAPIGVALCDAEDRVRALNPRGIELLGGDEQRVYGRPLPSMFRSGDDDRLRQSLRRLVSDSEKPSHELVSCVHGERVLHLDVTATRIPSGPGDPEILILLQDVTERQELVERLRVANRRKDEFLAMLGHELRNPLAPIRTALELMNLKGVVGGERERGIIERQANHLVELVDDLLDIARITRGTVELAAETVEVSAFVAEAIEMASPLIERRQHTLNVDVPPRGLAVRGDPRRLSQIVTNLLTNAAKYTEPGGTIWVSAGLDGGEAVVSVRDTGRGIAPEFLPNIFGLFSQHAQSIDRSEGGLGIGLAIVRGLVQMHGGTVDVRSEQGRGSEFIVRLPALAAAAVPAREAPEQHASPQAPQPAPDAVRVLIVDDNEDAAALLAELLQLSGFATAIAHDGPSALELAAQLQPQVAVLDIGLPVMSGYELARRLVELPGLDRLGLVAVTGYSGQLDRSRSHEAGFQTHLVKPVDPQHLVAAVEQAADRE